MASRKLDSMHCRTQLGTVNLYDNQHSIGTHFEKAQAARLGGHSFNPINFKAEEILAHARNRQHYINENGTHSGMIR